MGTLSSEYLEIKDYDFSQTTEIHKFFHHGIAPKMFQMEQIYLCLDKNIESYPDLRRLKNLRNHILGNVT